MPTLEQARYWYTADDPVHGFDHILRVYRLAEHLAGLEGADLEIVRAAVLLHDASLETHVRGEHQVAGAEFARRVLEDEGWEEPRIQAVQHCIRAHRFRDDSEQPETIEAQVLFDADKLDAIGAIGVARAVAYAAQAGQPIYAPASEQFRQTGQGEPGEPHSAYHEFLFKLVKIKERMYTSSGRRIASQRHAYMTAFFARLAAEVEGQRM